MPPSFIGFDAVCAGGVQKHHSHITKERKARPLAASPCNSTYSSPNSSSTDFSDGPFSSQEDTDQEFTLEGKSLTEDLQHVQRVSHSKSTNPINPANRRSLSFSECMMQEVLSYKPLGRDRDGIMNYALYLEESQGFRWNKNMQKFHTKIFAARTISPLNVAGLYDIYSDDDDFVDEDDTPSNERVVSID